VVFFIVEDRLLGRTVKNAPSPSRTLLSFMRGSVGAPWGETTPRINDMRGMHCVTPVGCGGDAGLGYLNSPSSPPAKPVNLQKKFKNVHRNASVSDCRYEAQRHKLEFNK